MLLRHARTVMPVWAIVASPDMQLLTQNYIVLHLVKLIGRERACTVYDGGISFYRQ